MEGYWVGVVSSLGEVANLILFVIVLLYLLEYYLKSLEEVAN